MNHMEPILCVECAGTGIILVHGNEKVCPKCGGTGSITINESNMSEEVQSQERPTFPVEPEEPIGPPEVVEAPTEETPVEPVEVPAEEKKSEESSSDMGVHSDAEVAATESQPEITIETFGS